MLWNTDEHWRDGRTAWSFGQIYGQAEFQFLADSLDSWLSRKRLYVEDHESGS